MVTEVLTLFTAGNRHIERRQLRLRVIRLGRPSNQLTSGILSLPVTKFSPRFE